MLVSKDSNSSPVESERLGSLELFLNEFRRLYADLGEPRQAPPAILPDISVLAAFCAAFRPRYDKLHRSGEFIDFWRVAQFHRNELRHTSALAWFLNPREAHGFDRRIFDAWVASLDFSSKSDCAAPFDWSGHYRVATEVCPLGDNSNRFDIEIDGERFYLCVEVKIDAPEGKNQLQRYHEAARKKANGRPCSVIYLTINDTAQTWSDAAQEPQSDCCVVSTTWRKFARAVREGVLARPLAQSEITHALTAYSGLSPEIAATYGQLVASDQIRQRAAAQNTFSDRLLAQFLNRVENF